MASKPFYEFLRDFAASLPASYRSRHGAGAIADHGRLAWTRRGPASVGAFRCQRGDEAALCVVADDRPGLLAKISAAFVVCGIDVTGAEAYTREVPGRDAEAIDLFWVRRAATPARREGDALTREELARVGRVLCSLLEGAEAEEARRAAAIAPRPAPSLGATRVRFRGERGQLLSVDVEATDRPGLLYALAAALFQQRLQIVGSELHTLHGRAFDRFNVRELDGAGVSAAREDELRAALLRAIGGAEQAPAAPLGRRRAG